VAADLLVRSIAAERGIPLTVMRPFSFTGAGDDRNRLFGALLRSAAESRPLQLTTGTQYRDHLSAHDVADGVLRAIDRPPGEADGSRIYNLGSGEEVSLRELLEAVRDELDLDVELQFGALPMRKFEPVHLVADTSRARSELGWVPRQNLAYAVWTLARESFPRLMLREPRELR